MATRKEIAIKYDKLYKDLHDEFFETINRGTPKQERILKDGKSANELNRRNAEITQNYEEELIVEGFEGLEPVTEPSRDLIAELDDLKARIEKLEKK